MLTSNFFPKAQGEKNTPKPSTCPWERHQGLSSVPVPPHGREKLTVVGFLSFSAKWEHFHALDCILIFSSPNDCYWLPADLHQWGVKRKCAILRNSCPACFLFLCLKLLKIARGRKKSSSFLSKTHCTGRPQTCVFCPVKHSKSVEIEVVTSQQQARSWSHLQLGPIPTPCVKGWWGVCVSELGINT